MPKSLKEQNAPAISVVLFINLALFAVLVQTNSLIFPDVLKLAARWQAMLPAGLGVVLSGVFNAQLGPETKARLVFWRWRDPLPASRAFSELGPRDPRVDMEALKIAFGEFPTKPHEQNVFWYNKFYKPKQQLPYVEEIHRSYLLYRDLACLSVFLMVSMSVSALLFIHPATAPIAYVGILCLQYLLLRRAAAERGERLVTSVMAAA